MSDYPKNDDKRISHKDLFIDTGIYINGKSIVNLHVNILFIKSPN